MLHVSEDYVRDVIHAFNERGFDALDPKWSGGRPSTISDQVRESICLIARTSPADWKIAAFSTWSLTKLAEQPAAHANGWAQRTRHRTKGRWGLLPRRHSATAA
ncbi:helix-turn-helix domain-containing protein [Streptomyces cocklensis]|uniref:Transposase n=1 Tax=Actinacidiphila cocklensis TaxID=887465 RepID=A0A9W4DRE9_9ACTN|nr:helix-turn-helix domain-containing protein [Actinacidiphila cocklensis]MDD1062632.1 helix-turn-helix domain-containing protein [Actinacidiphila cocklensis]CAG6392166.1 hypothetical protein SCOCK_150138 [Actinacidiphila cocklensis]